MVMERLSPPTAYGSSMTGLRLSSAHKRHGVSLTVMTLFESRDEEPDQLSPSRHQGDAIPSPSPSLHELVPHVNYLHLLAAALKPERKCIQPLSNL